MTKPGLRYTSGADLIKDIVEANPDLSERDLRELFVKRLQDFDVDADAIMRSTFDDLVRDYESGKLADYESGKVANQNRKMMKKWRKRLKTASHETGPKNRK